jgi:hypothetical protein
LKSRDGNRDRKFLLLLAGATLLLIALISVLAPATADNDPRPTSYNTGPSGAKAAFLMFEALGRETVRWEEPIGAMSEAEARRTTLILAQPTYSFTEVKALRAEIDSFLKRGGHVLATGQMGALLLPGGAVKAPQMLAQGLCFSTPKDGRLAAAGPVEISDQGRWDGKEPGLEVAQRCANDAVVVRFPVDRGEAVWWSSPAPLSNAGLRNDGNLKLLLLSVGEGRAVAFDESLRGETESFWEQARGLPLWWMLGQAALVFVLLVLSYGRRRGPVRAGVGRPRSSPVEFAESMGDLYERAEATGAATEAARRRLMEVLRRDARLPRHVLDAGPGAIAEALAERFGGEWDQLALHLEEARGAAEVQASARSALALVRALHGDAEKVRRAAAAGGSGPGGDGPGGDGPGGDRPGVRTAEPAGAEQVAT